MPTLPLNSGHNTLLDIAKSFDPNGKVAVVAELLNQSNELLPYMNFIEGNLPTGHKASVRVGLPTVSFREFYKGVAVSKSGRATIEDVCAILEGRNEIDKALADLNGNSAAFRLSEGMAFVEAMNQTFAQSIIRRHLDHEGRNPRADSALQPEVCHIWRQHHRRRRLGFRQHFGVVGCVGRKHHHRDLSEGFEGRPRSGRSRRH